MFRKILIACLAGICVLTSAVSCAKDEWKQVDGAPAEPADNAADENAGAEQAQAADAGDAAEAEPEAAPEPEPEPAPEPEPEPEPEPVPEIEYEYETVFELDFSTMEDTNKPPFTNNQVSGLRIEDGVLKGTSTGGDPFITFQQKQFPAFDFSEVQQIQLKLMNYGDGYDGQLFFTTDSVSWSEPASYRFSMYYNGDDGDDNDWNEIDLFTDESADWNGTITNFRLDPMVTTGDFEVAYIRFLKVTEKQG